MITRDAACERFRRDTKYFLLRSILDGDLSLAEVCRRSGLSVRRVEIIVLSDRDVDIGDVAVLGYATGRILSVSVQKDPPSLMDSMRGR